MNPELLLAHFDRVSDAPNAIPRLRGFILDLAVRGKLVEQDRNDEPAPELLNRIEAEKTRRIKEGGLRKERALSPIVESEIPFAVPSNWSWTRIGVCSLVTEYGTSVKSHQLQNGVPVLAMGNIQGGKVVLDGRKKVPRQIDDLPRLLLKTFDLLYNRTNSPELVGKTGIYLGEDDAYTFASYLIRIRFITELTNPIYVNLTMNAAYFRETQILPELKQQCGQANVNGSKLRNMIIPLPPGAEQRRIVAKVDELMALCDRLEWEQAERESRRDLLTAASHHHLNSDGDADVLRKHTHFFVRHIPCLTARSDQIKLVRQTILELAVRGKLVAQDPTNEAAPQLLKRIQAEKARLVESGEATEQKRVKVNVPDHDTFDIPHDWCWVSLGEIAFGFRYGTSTKCSYETTGEPVLRIPNIDNGRINIEDLKFGSLSRREADVLRLRLGDILMVRSNGSLDLVGRPAMVEPNTVDYCYAGYLVRVRTSVTCLDTRYLICALNTIHIRNQIELPIRTSVGLKNVNATELSALRIPLPPLFEQHRIVDKVDELMAVCDSLEERLCHTQSGKRHLLEAVLNVSLNDDEALEDTLKVSNG